jgi:hypothetical protein
MWKSGLIALGASLLVACGGGAPVTGNSQPPAAPSIVVEPAPQMVTVGQPAVFGVTASGTAPLSYQWNRDGMAIAGATASTYTTPVTVITDNGATFTVTVTNSLGTITSNPATLTVSAVDVAPTITTEPMPQSVTAGATATFGVVASGTAPLNYQWNRNAMAISGATSSTYTTPATVLSDNGAVFTVTVTNSVGTITSNPAALSVSAAPVAPAITTQPNSQSVTVGATATFSVVATGTAPLSYQWNKAGVAITGATASTYTTPATALSDNGATFTVTVSNSVGSITSAAALLTVGAAPVAPSITKQPSNQTVTAGQATTFSVVATGTAPLSYQWNKNGTAIIGAGGSSYTTPATALSDNGTTFSVTVSNSVGSITSNAATLTVNPVLVAPSITVQPISQAVNTGDTAVFSVIAAGTAPLSFQWAKGGVAIAGATASSYTTPATALSDNGSVFTVTVTNSAGSITSNSATLTVTAAPVGPFITTQPASQTVTAGQTATFSVVATGTAPLTYQWYKNGLTIPGATSSTYTTPAETVADNGAAIAVAVTNANSSILSTAATLTVNPAPVVPSITTQPANQSVTAGNTATFTVTATGTAPLSYQWTKAGVAISGATGTSYTTPTTVLGDSGTTFAVTVSNAAGSVNSATVTLTVTSAPIAPSITTPPSNQTVTAGQTATFSVVAGGTAPFTYQWNKNGTAISGATTSSYTTPVTTTADSGATFTVTVTNSVSSVTSSAATLTVNPAPVAPTISAQPANQGVYVGQTATFTVSAGGTAPLSYQWTKNGAAISGATGSSYTTPSEVIGDNGAVFKVTVTNSAGSVTSVAATLTVSPVPVAPTITSQPANQAVTVGQTASFSVVATGTAPLSYQWSKNGVAISGATGSSFTTPATVIGDNGARFTVVVTNSVGSVTSAAATLSVTAAAVAPTITTQPANQTVSVGQSATFSVVASGTAPLSYQWKKNGTVISGATASSYTTPATATTDNGASFTVTVSNAASPPAVSNAAILTVQTVAGTDVLTYHNDVSRTGQNLTETVLTPANVNSTTFGLLRMLPADGLVDAQPLVVSNLNIGGTLHNVVYVVSENDSVYAYDADTGTQLAHVSVIPSGEQVSDDRGCPQVTPTIGITSTPVIDRSAGPNGTIFLVAATKNGSNYYERVHALDLVTLAEQANSPVTVSATYPGTANFSNGTVIFDSNQYLERAALLLANGTVYTAFGSHCDTIPYSAWVMGYSETALSQTQLLNLTPNGNSGAGSQGSIWQAGGGMAADANGYIYALMANGIFDTTLNASGFPSMGDYGNAFVKISTTANPITVADYFTMDNTAYESSNDIDFGSSGPILLPDLVDSSGTTRHLAVGAGKDGHLYVVNRDNMGKFSMANNAIWQDLPGVLPGGMWATGAYFQGSVYYGDVTGTLKQFTLSQAMFGTTPASQTTSKFGFPGVAPSVSANGSSNGIVWAVENYGSLPGSGPGILHAYSASNLAVEYYNSTQAGSRDSIGYSNKFMTPTIANGKVFVGTPTGVAVFGLLP